MSAILTLINFFIVLLFVFTIIKNFELVLNLGGTLYLFVITAILTLFSQFYKKNRRELEALILIVLTVIALQYLNYNETHKVMSQDVILKIFLAMEIIIYALLLYVCSIPLQPNKSSLNQDTYKNKRAIFKAIIGRIYFYSFVSGVLAWIAGLAIQVTKDSYLVKNNIVSIVPVSLYVLVVSNIVIYMLLRKISDRYFSYLYEKRDINLSKIRKFIFYLFGISFILGSVLEVFTRDKLILYAGAYLFIFSLLLIIWRIYKIEDRNSSPVGPVEIDEISINQNFYIKYIIITTTLGTLEVIAFISFLKWFKP